eukprot:m.118009 g.118009  ORF g.118009 m.118009 type:complete len:87 (+) comp17195_c0_seq2:32-292(+)
MFECVFQIPRVCGFHAILSGTGHQQCRRAVQSTQLLGVATSDTLTGMGIAMVMVSGVAMDMITTQIQSEDSRNHCSHLSTTHMWCV